ncbi:MAG: threonine synthase [Deltaproteobacteria bacterium]|nr:threonine synthase [Deltaproteobacteria bacterium]
MDHVQSLKCLVCGAEYAPDQIDYVCPKHGDDGIVDVQYRYDRIAASWSKAKLAEDRNMTMWRYRPLMAIREDSPLPPLAVGWTPLYRTDRLAALMGLKNLWVKDDGRQPTASLKDRASAMAVVKGREKGAEIITTASTGNAAAALTGLCASVGQKNVIFVPQTAPAAKVAQLLVFGGTVLLVRGTYDDAFELCLKASKEFGWYNRNTAYNPYMTEGKKTVVLEICEQLAWKAPDRIFVSVGDGCIIGGIHKGLNDLMALGWIDKMPKIMGVQAAGSAAIYQAWKDGTAGIDMKAIDAQTIADSISAGMPRDRIKALAAARETGGAYIKVSDEEILAQIPVLGQSCGVFAEPAGAASLAGLKKALDDKLVSPDERIVVLVTGNGLKDIASARKSVGEPYVVDANLGAVQKLVGEWKTRGAAR